MLFQKGKCLFFYWKNTSCSNLWQSYVNIIILEPTIQMKAITNSSLHDPNDFHCAVVTRQFISQFYSVINFSLTEIYVWRLAIIILKHKSVKGHTVQRARVLIVCQNIDLQRNEIGLWCMYEATSQTSHVIVIAICPKETPLCICFRICNETK